MGSGRDGRCAAGGGGAVRLEPTVQPGDDRGGSGAAAGGANGAVDSGDAPGGGSIKNAVDESVAKNDQAVQGEQLLDRLTKLSAQPQTGGSSQPGEFTEPTSAPYVPPPPRPPSVIQGGGNMPGSLANWEWGVWADGTVEFYPNRAFGGTFVSGTSYQTIRDATPSRLLTGAGGTAGAVINGPGGYYNELTGLGGVSIQVLIGSSVTPSWGGTFNLTGSGGDSLSFVVDRLASPTPGGLIDANGHLYLNGPPAAYTLVANSVNYGLGTLSAQSVNGTMTTKPSLAGAIGGVAGSFSFQHGGSGPRVNGAFGVDLN